MFKTLFLPFLFVKKYAGTGGSEEGSSPMTSLAITGFWKGNSGFVKKEKKNVLRYVRSSVPPVGVGAGGSWGSLDAPERCRVFSGPIEKPIRFFRH